VPNKLENQSAVAGGARQQRKPYASPSLSELGCVRDLTATGTASNAENKGADLNMLKP
jgi:hypothetical protein